MQLLQLRSSQTFPEGLLGLRLVFNLSRKKARYSMKPIELHRKPNTTDVLLIPYNDNFVPVPAV